MSRDAFEAIGEIGECIRHNPECLLCLDLSGSLEQQISACQIALTWDRLKQVLASLVQRHDMTVAVMSGKDRGELHKFLPVNGMIYLGNHGLEISGPGQLFVEPAATDMSQELADLGELLSAKLAAIPGARVENKGLTLQVQYGEVASENAESLRRTVHSALAASDHPFHLTIGNGFFDIRPRVHWDKASAVALVKERTGNSDPLVIYMGDSQTGENSFALFPDALTVLVGPGSNSLAQFQIEDPDRLIDFLNWLDGFLQEQEHRLTDERQHHSMV